MRYLDGKSSAAEMQELNDLLRRDPEARKLLRDISEQAAVMGDIARSKSVSGKQDTTSFTQPARRFIYPLMWAAAIFLIVTSGLLWQQHHAARTVVTLTEANGSIIWNNGNGRVRTELQAGASLPAGTLETIGAVSSAQLRFDDGTLLTLAGNSECVFSTIKQKRIHLKSGSLTASVTRQPEGHPMLVRTPTAEVEVMGTMFAVSTQPEETRLNVEEGSVKFRRLADGNTMNVGARHSATASLNVQGPMQASTTAMPSTGWTMPLAAHPGGGSKGEWRDADSISPARMCGVPLIMGRKKDGSPVVHHGISIRETSRTSAGSFATLTHVTTLALRWRVKQPSGLFIFLITQRPGGAFGGNFELKLPPSAGKETSDDWHSISIPVSSFRPEQLNRTDFNGNGISALIVTTFEKDAGLEISLMGISSPGQTNDNK